MADGDGDDVAAKVLELKRRALGLKREGNIEEAKELLAQARDLELAGLCVEDTEDPLVLKKLAISLKRQGKLPEAKAALAKAKALEAEASEETRAVAREQAQEEAREAAKDLDAARQDAQPPAPAPQKAASPAPQTAPASPKPPAPDSAPPHRSPPTPPQTLPQKPSPLAPAPPRPSPAKPTPDAEDNVSESSDLQREYEMLLQGGGGDDGDGDDAKSKVSAAESEIDPDLYSQYDALLQEGDGTDAQDHDNGNDEQSPDLTDEELLDVDTLAELMEIGEPLPGKEIYDARTLACKQKALALKRAGDLERAKAALRLAKQFEAAGTKVEALSKQKSNPLMGALDDDNEDSDQGQGALDMGDGDDETGNGAGSDGGFDLSGEDLTDPDLLAEMVAIGMKVPAPEDLLAKVNALKREALQHKKAGDLGKAKEKLRESKAIEAQAKALEAALGKVAGAGSDSNGKDDVDIEAVLAGEVDIDDVLAQDGQAQRPSRQAGAKMAKQASNATAAAPSVPAAPKKTAAELKAEAIRLKQENKLPEAAKAFRTYKAALAEEESARAKAAIAECSRMLAAEAELADAQVRLYQFYSLFGRRAPVGKQQHDLWAAYARACRQAAQAGVVQMPPRSEKVALQRITNDLRFVETDVDVMDGDLHAAVICVLQAQQIETLTSVPEGSSLRVECVVGLPPSEAQSDASMTCHFAPASGQSPALATANTISFVQAKRLPMPRGESKHARMVLRRMARKKAEFKLLAVPPAPAPDPNAGHFFRFRKATPPPEAEPMLIGKVAIDLKPLLECNHIVGDFPLMNRSDRRPVGGVLRLAMRSGRPFSPNVPATIDNSSDGGAESESFAPLDLSALAASPSS